MLGPRNRARGEPEGHEHRTGPQEAREADGKEWPGKQHAATGQPFKPKTVGNSKRKLQCASARGSRGCLPHKKKTPRNESKGSVGTCGWASPAPPTPLLHTHFSFDEVFYGLQLEGRLNWARVTFPLSSNRFSKPSADSRCEGACLQLVS